MKVIIAARLSVLHDGETGLDSQEKEAIRWAETHGHEVVGIVADHKTGKSHLWDRPNLRPWVLEPAKLAEYDAIVALKVDRLTRAEDEGVDAMKAWARKNHKQLLISSADVKFPSEGMEGVRWDMYIRMAHQEWMDIRERYERMKASRHEAGSIVGRAPWGYEIVKVGSIKTLEPTAEGRVWVPRIFGWIAEGETARTVAERLEAAGIRSGAKDGRWREQSIVALIRVSTYTGLRLRKGRTALQVEQLVSRALQDQATAKLAARGNLMPSTPARPKALLAKLKCGHPDCAGDGTWPMYRTMTQHLGYVYRCNGKGPQRHGCGAPLIPLAALDDLVLNATEIWDERLYVSQRYVSGNDAGARLELLRTEMSDMMRVTPAGKIAAVATDYAARIAALEAQGSMQPHWEEVVTGKTEGEHLRSLDLDGQRQYLARKDIRAWIEGDVITVSIDGSLAGAGRKYKG